MIFATDASDSAKLFSPDRIEYPWPCCGTETGDRLTFLTPAPATTAPNRIRECFPRNFCRMTRRGNPMPVITRIDFLSLQKSQTPLQSLHESVDGEAQREPKTQGVALEFTSTFRDHGRPPPLS